VIFFLFLAIKKNPPFMFPSEKNIEKKRRGYATQDKKWEIYSDFHFTPFSEVFTLLQTAEMKCTYCKKAMLAEYSPRHPDQWTLDRIDNDYGHNTGNVLVCCLKCNLQRRSRDSKKFSFTKQLTIHKLGSGDVNALPG
jgi:hypothetical protein